MTGWSPTWHQRAPARQPQPLPGPPISRESLFQLFYVTMYVVATVILVYAVWYVATFGFTIARDAYMRHLAANVLCHEEHGNGASCALTATKDIYFNVWTPRWREGNGTAPGAPIRSPVFIADCRTHAIVRGPLTHTNTQGIDTYWATRLSGTLDDFIVAIVNDGTQYISGSNQSHPGDQEEKSKNGASRSMLKIRWPGLKTEERDPRTTSADEYCVRRVSRDTRLPPQLMTPPPGTPIPSRVRGHATRLARDMARVQHVIVDTNRALYIRLLVVNAHTNQLEPVVVPVAVIVDTLTRWTDYHIEQRHKHRSLAAYEASCLCPIHFGILGSGMHFMRRDADTGWEIFAGTRAQWAFSATDSPMSTVSTDEDDSTLINNLFVRGIESTTYFPETPPFFAHDIEDELDVRTVKTWTQIPMRGIPLTAATLTDTLSVPDPFINHDTNLYPVGTYQAATEDSTDILRVTPLSTLWERGLYKRIVLSTEETGCYAHCQALEERVIEQ